MSLAIFDLKTLLDEELSATQRHLDMSGITMPNFMNVGPSLRRELNEEEEGDDVDFDYEQLPTFNDLMTRNLHTPDLIIEEESDSELSEASVESTEEESKVQISFVL